MAEKEDARDKAAQFTVANATSEHIGNDLTDAQTTDVPFAFDADSEAQIGPILHRYPPSRKASAVIPLLYLAQNQMRRRTGSAWVPRQAMDVVAARLEMPPIRVYEVATFYLMFNTNRIGRYHLQFCGTTPCMLRGSDDVARAIRDATGIGGHGETSADGLFTMTEVECLGACVNAPILCVDDDYYEDLDYDRTRALIEALRHVAAHGGERPAPGSTTGRMTSAPEGGPTTLLTISE